MGAYYAAQPDDVPVQHLEFEDYEITPRVETLEFEDYEITPDIEIIEFEEFLITAQHDETDDGDGENLDMMNANWCLIHPDDVICQGDDKQDEEEGC
tara:strand:- start:983 stop:1273 length:291 start_codon:yes stop_codon:yes gene_type:complete